MSDVIVTPVSTDMYLGLPIQIWLNDGDILTVEYSKSRVERIWIRRSGKTRKKCIYDAVNWKDLVEDCREQLDETLRELKS